MISSRFVLTATAVVALSSSGCDKLRTTARETTGLAFGADFEGEITMNATRTGGGSPMTLVMGIKKPKYRVDATGVQTSSPTMAGGTALILDPPQKKGWALMPATKTAMVIDFEKMKAMKPPGMSPGGTKPGEPPPKLEKTGKKDTVAGYECDIWNITASNGTKTEACLAEGITWVDLSDMGWSSPELTIAAVASGANRFPLRVVAPDSRIEATKIEKKKLDESRFVVPPDYKVIDPAAMMQGLPKIPVFVPPK